MRVRQGFALKAKHEKLMIDICAHRYGPTYRVISTRAHISNPRVSTNFASSLLRQSVFALLSDIRCLVTSVRQTANLSDM